MGRKRKLTKNVDYMVSIWNEEDNQRLIDYIKKEYSQDIPKLDFFPKWIFFSLPAIDNVIDKKFASLVRREADLPSKTKSIIKKTKQKLEII